MAVPYEIVGEFVDACVDDHALADKLLKEYPELRSAKWMGESILRFVAIENFAEGVRFLAERGWPLNDVEQYGTTPLMDCVYADSYDSARMLLKMGADPNFVSKIEESALHRAISAGDQKMIDILLEGGAILMPRTNRGTPLIDAATYSDYCTAATLLKLGADPNAIDSFGFNALYCAIDNGDTSMVRMLLEGGADPNVIGPGAVTALYDALSSGNASMVQVLLEGGADPNFTTDWGHRATDVLEKSVSEPETTPRDRAEIMALLRKHGYEERPD